MRGWKNVPKRAKMLARRCPGQRQPMDSGAEREKASERVIFTVACQVADLELELELEYWNTRQQPKDARLLKRASEH